MGEGIGIALDSVRANKVRAALTILGVAIGVTVVIAMGSAITGINRSITAILESAGPQDLLRAALLRRRHHRLRRLRRAVALAADALDHRGGGGADPALPTVRDVNIGEDARGPVSAESHDALERGDRGVQPDLAPGQRRRHHRRPELHADGVRRGRTGRGDQRQARAVALPRPGPDRQDDQDLRRAVPGDRPPRRGRVALQQRERAAAGDPAHHLHQGGRLRAGLDGDRGRARRTRPRRWRPRTRSPPRCAAPRGLKPARGRTTSRS